MKFSDPSQLTIHSGDDIRAVAMAIEKVRTAGLDRWISGSLNEAILGDLTEYIKLIKRGMDELEMFLNLHHAL
jgi:hypothetical protein